MVEKEGRDVGGLGILQRQSWSPHWNQGRMREDRKEVPGWHRGEESACQSRRRRSWVGVDGGWAAGCVSLSGSGRSLGGGNRNPLQYSCWKIPWAEEPGGRQFIGSHRVGHHRSYHTHLCVLLLLSKTSLVHFFVYSFSPSHEQFSNVYSGAWCLL